MVANGSTGMTHFTRKHAQRASERLRAMPIASSRLSARVVKCATLMLCVQALGFLLGGCSSEGSGDWSAVFVLARDSWEHRDGAVQLSDAASIPYATLGLRIDGSAEHLVVLATDSGGKRL